MPFAGNICVDCSPADSLRAPVSILIFFPVDPEAWKIFARARIPPWGAAAGIGGFYFSRKLSGKQRVCYGSVGN
jgi:hypothetical protein